MLGCFWSVSSLSSRWTVLTEVSIPATPKTGAYPCCSSHTRDNLFIRTVFIQVKDIYPLVIVILVTDIFIPFKTFQLPLYFYCRVEGRLQVDQRGTTDSLCDIPVIEILDEGVDCVWITSTCRVFTCHSFIVLVKPFYKIF